MKAFDRRSLPPELSRRAVLLGGLSGAAALLAACSASSEPAAVGRSTASPASPVVTGRPAAAQSSAATSAAAPTTAAREPTSSSSAVATGRPVTVSSYLGDGALVGVGMPVVLSFDPAPTDASAFAEAARVTVNGKAVNGAWYWKKPYADQPVQAHFRMKDYWPANSTVKVELPIGGLSAGKGLVYRGELTSLTFRTGDKRVTHVDGRKETAVVMVNDKHHRTMKASLGKSATPTYEGIKLVMQKGEDVPGTSTQRPDGAVRMQNTAHTYDLIVEWSVRVTSSGEYLHAAPWNSEIGQVSTSDGCTNLSTTDAEWFYGFARVGDVVIHTNTGGDQVPGWDGFTDWNVPWSTWQRGGLLNPA